MPPSPHTQLTTHNVTNQPPALENYSAWSTDPVLRNSVADLLSADQLDAAASLGLAVGDPEWIERGFHANQHPPELQAFDRYGRRVDEVTFHPSYHDLMRLGMSLGVHSVAWTAASHGHLTHGVLQYLLTQLEPGVCCPLAMTYAAQPVLQSADKQFQQLAQRALATSYDTTLKPVAKKSAVTIGMAMTEKQGGSDVRANTTRAEPDDTAGHYRLTGHKWFCSAPMSDAFLTLAQTKSGISCFVVQRLLEDGTSNRIFIQRLKHKLGNRSNASAEIEYDDTLALLLGDEGNGIATILEMVQHTRFDAACAPAGMMRAALVQAIHHGQHRRTFGKTLVEQPLMQNVLADLSLESEAATLLALQAGKHLDQVHNSDADQLLARVLTIVAKYWINKRAPQFIYEAMECLGGGGYVEESMLPRLYREAPVNSIWEGSGNIICLDLLRVFERNKAALELVLDPLAETCQRYPAMAQKRDQLVRELSDSREHPELLRRCVESLAQLMQSNLLAQHAPESVCDLFVKSRIESPHTCYGTLHSGAPLAFLINRSWQRMSHPNPTHVGHR